LSKFLGTDWRLTRNPRAGTIGTMASDKKPAPEKPASGKERKEPNFTEAGLAARAQREKRQGQALRENLHRRRQAQAEGEETPPEKN
jgi:hypothetical protein